MSYFVHLIKSDEGFHYVGQTEILERRLLEHNSQLCHSTKHGSNWKLIHFEKFHFCLKAKNIFSK